MNGSWFQHQKKALEEVINGVYYDENFVIKSLQDGANKNVHVYLVPVECFNDMPYGQFSTKNGIVNISIGLKNKVSFWATDYYGFSNEDIIEVGSGSKGTLYLPLELLEVRIPIVGEKNKPVDGSPFQVYGLQGTKEKYPICFIAEINKEAQIRGLYRKPDGRLSIFVQKYEIKYYHQFMQRLEKINKPINPEKKAEASEPASLKEEVNWKDPQSIVSYLDKSIINQGEAKKAAAIAFSNYMIRKEAEEQDIPKDCLLFIGPTGSGKTMILKAIAQIANIPYAKASLTGKSAEGYVGHRLSAVFKQIRQQSKEEAPYGIVFLDEIDKIAFTGESFSNDYGPKLQQEMIGWLEGDKVHLLYDNDGQRKEEWFDTRNLLFVIAGAFHGFNNENSLESIISKRLGKGKKIGFGAVGNSLDEDILSKVEPKDLIKYGLKPELVGRISAQAILKELTIDDKVHILKESESSVLLGYSKLLSIKGYDFSISEDVLRIIAEKCPKETGARELNRVCSGLFREILYDPKKYALDSKIHLSPELARSLLGQKIETAKDI